MLKNLTLLFKKPDGTEVTSLRASTLGHYWYCAIQAWLQAQGIELPSTEAMEIGSKIHKAISEARKPSRWETEFETFIKEFAVEADARRKGTTGFNTEKGMVFQRAWYDGETIIGHVVTSGVDDFRVSPEREVVFVEYKTSAQKVIDHFKLAPGLFQLKVYMWIFEPLLKVGGYKIARGEIVYLNRNGYALGKKDVTDYDALRVEAEIGRILDQFKNPDTLIPPAKWKCLRCPVVFKEKCPYVEKQA